MNRPVKGKNMEATELMKRSINIHIESKMVRMPTF
jgi:hypothetical protein